MHCTPPHIPLVFLHKSPLPRLMHYTRIIPNHQITDILPLNAQQVLLLRRMA